MSESKFRMAQKLFKVQMALMNEKIQDFNLDSLIPLIFQKCYEENIAFWFNLFQNEIVLNLRDIGHENYELNIRYYYEGIPDIDSLKIQVLINAFNLTGNKVILENNEDSSALHKDETQDVGIISSNHPTPKHITEAIKTIQSKGIPVTPEAIHNHLPWDQMSSNSKIKCNKYLKDMKKQMEALQ